MDIVKKLKNKNLLREKVLIGSKWVPCNNKNDIFVYNPATNEKIGKVPSLDKKNIHKAIDMSSEAQKKWKEETFKHRSDILLKWYKLVIDNKEDLAKIMTLEQGKVISESLAEIDYGASFIKWFAEEGRRSYGDVIPSENKNSKLFVINEPIGVCAAITPWNFPNAMITRKVAPALASGCSVLVKPAIQTPYSAIALCYLAQKAGLPNGLFSVLTGSTSMIGEILTTDETIKKISFTGSTEVGKKIMNKSSSTLKKLSLELGGNAPFIVCEDANIDAAVDGLMASKFRNSGQTCVCANRIFLHKNISEEFIKKIKSKVIDLKIGDGFNKNNNQGPLIDAKAVLKMKNIIKDAIKKGAKIVVGTEKIDIDKGNYFQPTIIKNINENMLCFKEEVFGPIVPIYIFKNYEEVIKLANKTNYGLAAYFYSKNISLIWNLAEKIEAGVLGVNTGIISTAVAPFGGVKFSGMGREGSRYGMSEYLEKKYISMSY